MAYGIRRNIWKDWSTLRAAVRRVAELLPDQDVLFLAVGEDSPPETIGRAEVRFVPYQREQQAVARYYQAADVYVHAANADTFPNTVLEALACRTPVVATAVGGIPEQIRDGETGFLVSKGDVEGLARRTAALLGNDKLRHRLGKNAARDARDRFDLKQQVETYLNWYREILHRRNMQRARAPRSDVERGTYALSNAD